MEMRIEKPFRLYLNVVETDGNIPSVRTEMAIEVVLFGQRLEYQGGLWFDCSVLNAFVGGMKSKDAGGVQLVDMGGYFSLRVTAAAGKPEISWELTKKDMAGAVVTAAFRAPIDEDTLAHVRNHFVQFVSCL
jgi:hypothetical protein